MRHPPRSALLLAGAASVCVVEHSVTCRWGPGFQGSARITNSSVLHGGCRLPLGLAGGRRDRPGLERPVASGLSCRGHRERGPQVPLATGEIGENTCAHSFTDHVPAWCDARGPSHPGRPRSTLNHAFGPAPITARDGTPMPFGSGLRDQLRSATP